MNECDTCLGTGMVQVHIGYPSINPRTIMYPCPDCLEEMEEYDDAAI